MPSPPPVQPRSPLFFPPSSPTAQEQQNDHPNKFAERLPSLPPPDDFPEQLPSLLPPNDYPERLASLALAPDVPQDPPIPLLIPNCVHQIVYNRRHPPYIDIDELTHLTVVRKLQDTTYGVYQHCL